VKKLTASVARAGELFGFSVAVSGDTAVVGALRGDAGAAYVFRRGWAAASPPRERRA
jgi:hypothetical protein